MNKISIVIPVFNAPEFVIKCINSIRDKTDQVEYKYRYHVDSSLPKLIFENYQ